VDLCARPNPFYPVFRAQSRIEKHMKDYVRGPTEAQLIEALETLQKAARNESRTERPASGP